MHRRWFPAALGALFLATVFSLAITKIQDTDAWMHLILGKMIWLHKGLPATEPYVFTSAAMLFSYSSWLFGLLYYLSYALLNSYGVILVKACAATALFAVLLGDALRPYRNLVVSLITLSLMVMMLRFRFIERPDLFAMLILAYSIYSLNAFLHKNGKYIYALPVAHLVWSNMHSSIGLMAVPFLAFLAGGILQRTIRRAGPAAFGVPSVRQLATIGLVMVASFGASLINPNGFSQYYFGAAYLADPFFKQVIIEFQPLTWSLTKWPYLVAGGMFLSFLLNRRRFSIIDLLLVVPFLILPFSAGRFIIYFGVVAGPVISRNISGWIDSLPSWKSRLEQPRAMAFAAIWVLACGALAITNTVTVAGAKLSSGFGVEDAMVPERALRFMDRERISGPVFNLFDWGGYIAWRDYPRRSVFIDPRGVVPKEHLEHSAVARYYPETLNALAKQYGFETLLLDYPAAQKSGSPVDRMIIPGWALVFWDDISLLYVRKDGPFERVVKAWEYREALPDRKLDPIALLDGDRRMRMERELLRAAGETGSTRAYGLLGSLYNEQGKHEQALEAYQAALANPLADRAAVLSRIGYTYDLLGSKEEALRFYERSLAVKPDPAVEYLAGKYYLDRGDAKKALSHIEQAVKLDPGMTALYPVLTALYRELGMDSAAEQAAARYRRLLARTAGDDDFRAGLTAYASKDYRTAIRAFRKALDANPGNAVACSNIGYIYFDLGDLEKSGSYQRKAIGIDPSYANAHYGLALVLMRLGDSVSAKGEWREYLRLEPKGYYSRRALEAIRSIDGNK